MQYNIIPVYCLFVIALFASCSQSQKDIVVTSPGNKTEVKVWIDESGRALWQLAVKNGDSAVTVLNPSVLGLTYDDEAFSDRLKIKRISNPTTVNDNYQLLVGKTSQVDATGKQFTVTLANAGDKELLVHFRVYDDGAAYQYEIPGEGTVGITEEASTFAVYPDEQGSALLHPYEKATPWAPAYEEYFYHVAIGTNAPEAFAGWSYPMLFKTNGKWMLVTEAGNEAFSYGGTQISSDCTGGIYKVRFSQPEEAQGVFPEHPEWNIPTKEIYPEYPELSLPAKTNWRVVIAGDEQTVLASNMVQTLNDPSPYTDTDWISPGISSWSWWSLSDSPKDYHAMLPHIDMASSLDWPYFLVDANWDMMQNGDIGKVVEYAKGKNVQILLWYNSGGPHNVSTERPRDIMNDPERRKQEMAWLEQTGIKGIKVDFFQSDKPGILQLYRDILEDAMQHRILVNFHGCTLPRGWERTYPNLMTMEAVKGGEAYRFDAKFPESAPPHNVNLVFTRNAVGSMDYTPTTFTDQTHAHRTTPAHELALSVLFESGIVHIADAVAGIMSTPEYVRHFLRRIPATWNEIKYLYGAPGKDVVIARRKGDSWYIAGINGEKIKKNITIDCSFLPENTVLELIADGNDGGFERKELTTSGTMEIAMMPFGGFVLTTDEKRLID